MKYVKTLLAVFCLAAFTGVVPINAHAQCGGGLIAPLQDNVSIPDNGGLFSMNWYFATPMLPVVPAQQGGANTYAPEPAADASALEWILYGFQEMGR